MTSTEHSHQLTEVEDADGTKISVCSCGQASDDASNLNADGLPVCGPLAWGESHLSDAARSTGW